MSIYGLCLLGSCSFMEAALSMGFSGLLIKAPFGAFSPRYIKNNDITGVVTFSDVKPMVHCRFEAIESWLGTPKSTNITVYSTSNTDQTLAVINIHAVNFSFGLLSYRAQLDAFAEVLSEHQAPVIFLEILILGDRVGRMRSWKSWVYWECRLRI
jgi:hypothetical protein